MIDTLKTTSIGGGSFLMQFIEMVPEFVKVCVGLVTIVYLGIKIYKELKK